MFEKNTKQVNRMIANMFAAGSVVILILVICSEIGIFEFGRVYTRILLCAGLIIALSPSFLIHFLPDHVIRYYMLGMAAVLIGFLGTNNHIGVYMTYALVPVVSCLYFEPKLVLKTGTFSYFIMLISVYLDSAHLYEVIYQNRPRMQMFIAYALGFTVEFLLVDSVLFFLVKRAKQMMEERYSAQEQNRMKSEFLSNMSHEIRTPMNAIIGMSEVALQKEMGEDVRHCLEIIRSSSTGLLEIINDILDISKVEAGKLKIISTTYTTKSLLDDMQAIINARNRDNKVPLYYHIQEGLPEYLEGDVVRIKQVMLNYASNAIKYTEEGQIDITVGCEHEENGQVNLIYKVQDTGQGIRKEDLGKLFTMYTQLNQDLNHGKEGTGIGLALSKSFIERMGGSVSVKSTYGKGSTFAFSVPQKIGLGEETGIGEKTSGTVRMHCEKTVPGDATQRDIMAKRPFRILVVDDNDINREVINAMLESQDYVIEEARDGKEAVEASKSKFYDLILMDSHMPVMSGEEATRAIRSEKTNQNQTTPIIAITADAISGVREKLLESGMNDCLMKPIEMQQLYKMIKKYLQKEE